MNDPIFIVQSTFGKFLSIRTKHIFKYYSILMMVQAQDKDSIYGRKIVEDYLLDIVLSPHMGQQL